MPWTNRRRATPHADEMSPAELKAPDGATPLDPEETEGLLPSHVATQAQLNEWEHRNITLALGLAFPRRTRTVVDTLTCAFAEQLHRRMFDQTWRWAGRYRTTGKNIGVPAERVRIALQECLLNTVSWHDAEMFPADERAARFHHQLVLIHPWPNGNGRWARLLADAYLHAAGYPPISWGGAGLNSATAVREAYIAALRSADRGIFDPLLRFVRT